MAFIMKSNKEVVINSAGPVKKCPTFGYFEEDNPICSNCGLKSRCKKELEIKKHEFRGSGVFVF